MTQATWNKLSLFEQLSNVGGDVERLVSTKEKFDSGQSKEDYSDFYLDELRNLVDMTIADPKYASSGGIEFPRLKSGLY